MKADAEMILKETYPILNNANEQLDKLNRGDISEIKQNNNPHHMIKFAIECIAILLDEKPDYDQCKKTILSDAYLLTKLKKLNCEKITFKTQEKIRNKCIF